MTANMASFCYDGALRMLDNGHLSQAEALLTQAASLDGWNPLYHEALGLCRYALGRFTAAKSSWLVGASMEQENGKAADYLWSMEDASFRAYLGRYNACVALITDGKHWRALAAILPAAASLPNVEVHNLAGLLCHQIHLRKSARRFWRQAHTCDLANSGALRYLAQAREGRIPFLVEKGILGVLSFVGKRQSL